MQVPEITRIQRFAHRGLSPQILCVAADKNGDRAISYTTRSMWIEASGSIAAYSLVVAPDGPLFIVNVLNPPGCTAVVVPTAWKRRQAALFA